jgi:hypothetical protein
MTVAAQAVLDPSISQPPSAPPAMRLVCRQIRASDRDAAVDLLSRGFPERSPAYWLRAFDRLELRSVPAGYPRFGYVLTDHDRIVGILLTLFCETDGGAIRGNVSSWYVDEAYRGFSHLLLAAPLKMKDVTLVNISPAPSTIETIRAQGFSSYAAGSFGALAALAPPVWRTRVRRAARDTATSEIVADHLDWPCVVLEVVHRGVVHPFVFAASRFARGRLRCVRLVYCRSMDEFVRFAGPLGRKLLTLGYPIVLVDADGPILGVPGVYRAKSGFRFFRGRERPRLGDLSYTELAVFGI